MIIILTITDDKGENVFNTSARSIESLEGEIGRFQRHFLQEIVKRDHILANLPKTQSK